ncbi:MAG: [FeFe] hydrogenase H-cluster radical SAM maturase HydG [Candidatus Melainabacteria bacterium RIFOXYA12_FULL_32_12]|nr:MAG: [FeFe] hydrogenase H-cluster radical SAM maturase HydG [Candidatus Melainabacteria bacterium RIFOXYA12_FULL_32_12]
MEITNRIFIDEDKINELIESKPTKDKINEILDKSLSLKGLTLEEAAFLLNVNDDELLEKLFKAAKTVKEKIYGKRIVLFAPLYLSNYCSNNCLYCGFRIDNKNIQRKVLTVDEVLQEVREIVNVGHKRILLVAGEDIHKCNLDYIEGIINKIYEQKILNGEVRRININIAPLSVEEFKRLGSFGIGTYQSFQETYHKETYKMMHPSGLKANYDWRVETMDRALEAGLHDVGMGALFGLTDYRFEVLAMLMHAEYLDKKYGTGPHTLSIPRIEPAQGSALSESPPNAINDKDFKKIIAVLRLAVPYTGIILSTRERAEFRRELLELGVSQISAGSKTNPGGYKTEKHSTEQFSVGDTRSLDEVIYELSTHGYIPSFCTSCYRLGRVGKDFMDYAKPGLIQRFCQPNALLTFKEYLLDYASDKTKEAGKQLINQHLTEIPDEKIREKIKCQLAEVEQGKRDIYI